MGDWFFMPGPDIYKIGIGIVVLILLAVIAVIGDRLIISYGIDNDCSHKIPRNPGFPITSFECPSCYRRYSV